MLMLADVKEGDVVYDLGCGDGRVVITAAREFGARGVGVELREDLVRKAQLKITELGIDGRVTILHENMFNVDLRNADVVTLYLTTSANTKVKPKLEKELKPGTRIVSHDFQIRDWILSKTQTVPTDIEFYLPNSKIYLYKIT